MLQVPELTDGVRRPWSARLCYAYADALLDAGRTDEARDWFGRAAALDPDEETDAAERYELMDSVVIEDLTGPEDGEPEHDQPEHDRPEHDQADGEQPDHDQPDHDQADGDQPAGEA